jgi:hypothetical protein
MTVAELVRRVRSGEDIVALLHETAVERGERAG